MNSHWTAKSCLSVDAGQFPYRWRIEETDTGVLQTDAESAWGASKENGYQKDTHI